MTNGGIATSPKRRLHAGSHACNGIALTQAVARAVVQTLVDEVDAVVTGGAPAVRDGRHWSHWRPADDLRFRLTPRAASR